MTGEGVSGGGTGQTGTGQTCTGQFITGIVGDRVADIQSGHIDDDVANVLAERLRRAGIEVRPEEVEDLAEEIENHASR